jgi:uncharacterized membrane protein YkoI
MKKAAFTTLLALSGALVLPVSAEKVQLEQLSPEAQRAIRAQVGSERIEDIDRETRNGRTVYEVAFKRNGQHTEIRVEDPGTAVAAPAASSGLGSRKIGYSELPANVKAAADAHLAGAEVNDVDRQVRNGQVTYEIGYKRNNGRQQELLISEHGNVLSTGSVAAASGTATPQPPPRSNPRIGARDGSGGRTMSYSELPAGVRQAAESRLSRGEVTRVERYAQNGEARYRIGFQREDGEFQQLVLSPAGVVISHDTFASAAAAQAAANQAAATGAPGVFQSGAAGNSTTTQASSYSFVTSPVPLSNPEEMSRADLPSAVRQELRKHTQASAVQEVMRGEWRGRTVYQVGFDGSDNRYVELQFDDRGQVIYDPRLAGQPAATPAQNLIDNIGRALFDNNER